MAHSIKSKFKDINRSSLNVRGSVRLIIRILALFISQLNLICTRFLKLALLQSSGKVTDILQPILLDPTDQTDMYPWDRSNASNRMLLLLFVFLALQPIVVVFSQPDSGLQCPRFWGFLITHNDAPQSVGLLWTSDQSVAETSTWKHKTLTTDKHPCPRWDSNPQSQQASGRRPTP